jgi:hypothetical protein
MHNTYEPSGRGGLVGLLRRRHLHHNLSSHSIMAAVSQVMRRGLREVVVLCVMKEVARAMLLFLRLAPQVAQVQGD